MTTTPETFTMHLVNVRGDRANAHTVYCPDTEVCRNRTIMAAHPKTDCGKSVGDSLPPSESELCQACLDANVRDGHVKRLPD